MKNRIFYFSVTLSIFFTLIAGIANGQTRDWIGGVGGWDVPGNWNPAGVPSATDDVTIGVGDDVTVPAGFAAVAKSVTMSAGGDMTIAGTGSLEINGSTANGINMSGTGTTMMNEGSLKIGNTTAISLSGILMGSGSVFSNAGSGSIEADRITNYPAIWLLDANTLFDNGGTIKMGSLGTIKDWGIALVTSASFNNNAGASIEINNTVQNGGIYMEANTAFNNAGTIKIGNTAHIEIYGVNVKSGSSFTNEASGIIEIDGVTGAVHYTIGVIRVEDAGTEFVNSGTLKIGSNSACSNNGIMVRTGSSFYNTSAIPIEINNITDGGAIAVIDNGSTVTNAGIIKAGNLTPVKFGMGAAGGGSFNNNAGATLEINRVSSGNGLSAINGGTCTNAGIINIGNLTAIAQTGLLVQEGTFTNNSTGAIEINNITTGNGILFTSTAGSIFTNAGSIKIGNLSAIKTSGIGIFGSTVFGGGPFRNNAGGVIEINNVTDLWGIDITDAFGPGQGLTNAGTIRIGNSTAVKSNGIDIYRGLFTNSASGVVEINRITTNNGIYGSQAATVVNAGSIKIGHLASVRNGIYMELNTAFTCDAGSSLEINNIPAFGSAIITVGHVTFPANFTNNGTVKVGNISAVHDGVNLSGATTIGATGIMEINNTSSSAFNTRGLLIGGTCTNSGSIKIGNLSNVSAFGFVVGSGATFTNASGATVEIDRIPNNGIGNSALSISATGMFSNAGTLKLGTLSSVRVGIHNNTGSGTAVVNNTGTITFNNIILQGIAANVMVNNNAGGLIETPAAGKLNIFGTLVNNLNATILNAGTLTVAASFGTLTNNGTVKGTGTIVNSNTFTNNTGSTLAPGASPGTLTVTGPLNLGSATYACEINGTTAGMFDRLAVSANANLTNAALMVTWGFTPAIGNSFIILTASSLTGTFASVNIPPVSGRSFAVQYTATSVTIVVSAPLPVELFDFSAKVLQKTVRLDWTTATETNNKGFFIERSADGERWQTLGFVGGQGNSIASVSYSFLDEKPFPGINYYRLLQVDFDGRETFSAIVPVTLEDRPGKLAIYPNPVTAGSECLITYPFSDDETMASLRVLDAAGREVAVSNDAKRLITNDLQPGVYWLEVRSDLGYSIGKLVVQ